MAMVIKHNLDAARTLNMMDANHTMAHKHLMKVSTGMKVRDAQDDAAAFAISERMRVRIRALEQAHNNTQNGSNMIRTAEGAVSSIIDALRTLKEKAIDAANDSNSDEDRRMIQKEFDQLVDQIDEDALITFNGMHLINDIRNNALVSTQEIMSNYNLSTETTAETTFAELMTRTGESLGIKDDDIVNWSVVANGQTFHGQVTGNTALGELFANAEGITAPLIEAYNETTVSEDVDKFGNNLIMEAGVYVSATTDEENPRHMAGFTLSVTDANGTVNKFANAQLQFKEFNRGENQTGDRALSFHVGANANIATKFALTDMRANALGLKGSDNKIISISTKDDANAAIAAIDNILERVLDQQTTIGAALVRLERTATNLTTSYTDDQASESVIRDADMAKEMTGYAKYNLLSQTSQAMLAHANQNPMDVLYLLGEGQEE